MGVAKQKGWGVRLKPTVKRRMLERQERIEEAWIRGTIDEEGGIREEKNTVNDVMDDVMGFVKLGYK